MSNLLIATHNVGKLREFARLFDELNIATCSLDDAGITHDVEETGTTFTENARLKAVSYMQMSNLPTLADDSGLEVMALNGEPGVYSARYGDVKGAAQLDYLLHKLEGVPLHERIARFVCVIALARPDGVVEYAEGILWGVIELAPRGSGGFGYDPLFYVLDEDKTLAELSPEEKNRISHRAAAAQEARAILARWQAEGWF